MTKSEKEAKNEREALLKIDKLLIVLEQAPYPQILSLNGHLYAKDATDLCNIVKELCDSYGSYSEIVSIEGLNQILKEDIPKIENISDINQWQKKNLIRLMEETTEKIKFYILGVLQKIEKIKTVIS